MDVKVFNAGQPRVDEETFADGQAVWSRHPDAGVKFCGFTSPQVMVANKPGTPGRARSSR